MENTPKKMVKTGVSDVATETQYKIELDDLEMSSIQCALSEAAQWNEDNGYKATARSIRDLKIKFKNAKNGI